MQNKKVRIIIVSAYFSPIHAIGSIRPTKISKIFSSKYNTDVTVICSSYENHPIDEESIKDLSNIDKIIRIKQNPLSRKVSYLRNSLAQIRKVKNQNSANLSTHSFKSSKNLELKLQIKNYFRAFISRLEAAGYILQAKKKLKEIPDAEIIITSFSPKSSSLLGRWYKRKNPSVFWVADYRDPVFNYSTLPLFRNYEKSFVRRICKKSDIITGVSQGCLDSLFLKSHSKSAVLTNGFDREDIYNIHYSLPHKFTLSYLGYLYSGKRDISPLFKIITELLEEKSIDKNDISIQYAGPSKGDFLLQASFFDFSGIVSVFDSVTRLESLKKQLESHLLILATWNDKGEEGQVSGKFLEYMMMDRPIIALVSGNLNSSIVKKMMIKGDLGFCYEEATKETDEFLLKEYILMQYNLFKQNRPLKFNPDKEYIEQFNYNNITKQLVALFPENLKERMKDSNSL